MSEDRSENRLFQRHESNFTVSIMAREGAKEPIEIAIMKDISGSGLSFISARPDQYTADQELFLFVHLPVARNSSAGMQGKATVVRTNRTSNGDASICLHLNEPLSFSTAKQES